MTDRATGVVTFQTPSDCHELNNWILIHLDHGFGLSCFIVFIFTHVSAVFSVSKWVASVVLLAQLWSCRRVITISWWFSCTAGSVRRFGHVRTMNPSMEEVALESALARESYRFRLDVIKLCQTHSIAAKYCSFPVVYDFIPRSHVSNFVDKHKITQVNTCLIPVCGPLSLLSSQYFKDLHVLSADFQTLWTKGTFRPQATAEYADHVKHDVGARKIGRLFAGISRRRNGSVLENLRTSGPSTPEDTWRDLYGYAFMTKHVHKSLSKIEISFVWHSCTAAFRDIFVCQGSARLSFAPLFWCQEGISYVALDLPGFEAPVTKLSKFVLNFRSSTTRKPLTQLTCCRVLMPGRCEALLQSHVVSTLVSRGFL